MGKGRLEAFSDGVIAVIITIMVLELHAPEGADVQHLLPLLPKFLTYVLSFVFVGIYWVNHHHFFHLIKHVSGALLWANLNLLFWLSLIPFTTAWMGENHFTPWPVFIYGLDLLACAVAYSILARLSASSHGRDSEIGQAVARDRKGSLSLALYVISLPLAFLAPMLSCLCFVIVALIWLVPDRQVEQMLRG